MNPLAVMPRNRNSVFALLICGGLAAMGAPSLSAADFHVLPEARGSGDGSSWANAAAAPAADGWGAEIARLAPGDALRVGSGAYPKVKFGVGKGGAKGAPIVILGEDTGGGLPVFRGSWAKEKPAAGEIFCTIGLNAGFVTIKNLRIENYLAAIVTSGGNEGLVISGLEVKDVRMGVTFKNNARADNPSTWTRDVLVENCTFQGFTKSALRWEGGNRDFRIVNCHGDAGGKPYATDPFHMIYDIRGDTRKDLPDIIGRVHDNNITFAGCTARNAWHEAPAGKNYWNGDGFVAERGVSKLTFVDCMAFDCTDGGWDLKADGVVFKGCVAFRNKRNFRIWGESSFENCIAGYPVKRGGSGGAANFGVYTKGALVLDRCTLVGDAPPFDIEVKGASPDATHVRISNSLVVSVEKELPPLGKQVTATDTEQFIFAKAPKGPVFTTAPSADWDGRGTAFNSLPAYGSQGFRREAAR
ncbi:MAG: hypothetical protein K0R17_945 [Rariglobus sp.]|jgi:hypothetical protein|nr:hypothetical protein [Rariglobus sp.]